MEIYIELSEDISKFICFAHIINGTEAGLFKGVMDQAVIKFENNLILKSR